MDYNIASRACPVQQGLGGGAVEVGVGGVGANAEDDGVEVREGGGSEVGYGDHRWGEADGGEGFGDGIACARQVGDADVGWELRGRLETTRVVAGV